MAADESVRDKFRSVSLVCVTDSFLNSWELIEKKYGEFDFNHYLYTTPSFIALSGTTPVKAEQLTIAQRWVYNVLKSVEAELNGKNSSRTDLILKLISIAPSLCTWHTTDPIQLEDQSGKPTNGTNFWLNLARVIHAHQVKYGNVSDLEAHSWNYLKPFVLKFEDIDPSGYGSLVNGRLPAIMEE